MTQATCGAVTAGKFETPVIGALDTARWPRPVRMASEGATHWRCTQAVIRRRFDIPRT